MSTSATYSKAFYDETLLTSMRSAAEIVPIVLNITGAKSVADIGCGTGSWLRQFSENGVSRILGIDNASVDTAQLQIPKNCLIKHDLTRPFELGEKFDLVTCLEVAEHLPANCAAQIVDNLTSLGGMILFSAAIPHQGGTSHINEQWPEYWANLFLARGFRPVDCIREQIWQNDDVAYWYAQNLLLYVREDLLKFYPHLQSFAKRTNPHRLTMIHPKTYVKNYYSVTRPSVLLMRSIWNILPRNIRLVLVRPFSEIIWRHVSTKL